MVFFLFQRKRFDHRIVRQGALRQADDGPTLARAAFGGVLSVLFRTSGPRRRGRFYVNHAWQTVALRLDAFDEDAKIAVCTTRTKMVSVVERLATGKNRWKTFSAS